MKSDKSKSKKDFFGWFKGKKQPETPEQEKAISQQEELEPEKQRVDFNNQTMQEVVETPEAINEPVPVLEPGTEGTNAEDTNTEEPGIEDTSVSQNVQAIEEPDVDQSEKPGFFSRLKSGLRKTRDKLGGGIATLVLGRKQIDDELLEELETQLILADVGMDTTQKIMNNLTQQVARKELADPHALIMALKKLLADLLVAVDTPLEIDEAKKPYVILMVGVNGVGKTTTIGKLAKRFQKQGKSVMLAAGDTFRAAAVEQLQVWGDRNDIPVIAQHTGADSASVLFDALESAKARGVDVLIADTAGRLHTKSNLMEELIKVKRVMQKLEASAPNETLLVLDAGTGQNAINQVEHFNKAVKLSGLVLTKLDGTAKGGVLFALADKFKIPIRYIGVGEAIDDLRTFQANDFIEALFDNEIVDEEIVDEEITDEKTDNE